jgi:hypothetical protein
MDITCRCFKNILREKERIIMKFCVKCRIEMHCEKNGVGIDFGNGHVYPGDKFKCPGCRHEIITATRPSFDPEYAYQDEYILAKK